MVYADTSATVKLLVAERETEVLEAFLEGCHEPIATSRVGVVELRRVARRIGAAPNRADAVAAAFTVVELDDGIEAIAIGLDPALRALDAIHLASAIMSRKSLAGFVCYDRRLAEAAAREGLRVVAPGADG